MTSTEGLTATCAVAFGLISGPPFECMQMVHFNISEGVHIFQTVLFQGGLVKVILIYLVDQGEPK